MSVNQHSTCACMWSIYQPIYTIFYSRDFLYIIASNISPIICGFQVAQSLVFKLCFVYNILLFVFFRVSCVTIVSLFSSHKFECPIRISLSLGRWSTCIYHSWYDIPCLLISNGYVQINKPHSVLLFTNLTYWIRLFAGLVFRFPSSILYTVGVFWGPFFQFIVHLWVYIFHYE